MSIKTRRGDDERAEWQTNGERHGRRDDSTRARFGRAAPPIGHSARISLAARRHLLMSPNNN
jgi:hypothetical protein